MASVDPKDFSNIVKVDTHIHLAAAMTQRALLDFIVRKAKECPIVRKRNKISFLFFWKRHQVVSKQKE